MDANEIPVSYRGVPLRSTKYYAYFEYGEGAGFDTLDTQFIESDRPDAAPVHVRGQQQGVNFVIAINVLETTQENIDDLKALFNPKLPRGNFVKEDGVSRQTEALVLVTKLQAISANVFKVSFRLAEGIFTSIALTTTPTVSIDDSGDQFDVEVIGTDYVLPSFTITPRDLLPNTANWTKQRRILIANKSDQPLIAYPILFSSDVSAYSITPGADVRIVLDGADYPRYFVGNKLWSPMDFAAGKMFTSGQSINASYTGVLLTTNIGGLTGWEQEGYFFLGDEAVRYTYDSGILTVEERGALGSTAASHSLGLTGYWIEHPELVLIWDYTSPQAANEPDDQKPVIDLTNSTNNQWRFPGPFFNDSDLRAGAWRKEYTEDNNNSKYITCYESGGKVVFDQVPPLSPKPLGDNMVLELPCALSSSLAGVSLTKTEVAGTATIPVEGVAWRARTVRTDYTYQQIDTGVPYNLVIDESVVLSGTTKVLEQVSSIETETSNLFPLTNRGSDSEYTQYQVLPTGNFIIVGNLGVTIDPVQQVGAEKTVVPLYTTRTTYTQERGTLQSLTAMVMKAYGTDKLGNEGELTLDAVIAIPIYRVRLNIGIPVGNGDDGAPLTDSPAVIVTGTACKTQLDDIIINFNSSLTPKIVIGDEQDLYMINGRLYNVNTGDSVYLSLPAQVDQAFVIDCAQHKLTEVATDIELASQISATNARLWLPAYRGINTYAFELDGISGGNGAVDIDVVHRNGWL